MRDVSSIGALTLAAMLCVTATSAGAHDETKYPDMRAQWTRIGSAAFDPNKPGVFSWENVVYCANPTVSCP